MAISAASAVGPLAAAQESRRDCTSTQARRTTIEEVQSNFERWFGRCVRIRGVRLRYHLYSSREATLGPDDPLAETSSRSIVLYPGEHRDPLGDPEWVEVTGRAGSCAFEHEAVAAMLDDEPDDSIIMVAGYCHTSMENYVRPDRIRRLRRHPIPRLTEAEVPPERRSLVQVPDGTPVRRDHILAARELVAAIATADEAAFLRLTRPDVAFDVERLEGRPAPDRLREDLEEIRARFVDPRLAALFRPIHPLGRREERVFVEREEVSGPPGPSRTPLSRLVVCWCRSPDCRGRWPVTPYDADNDASRPYGCVRTHDFQLGVATRSAVQALPDIMPRGFAEAIGWPR